MARCRDIIIERGRWICSVLLMSALGASVFGVAAADGHGSEWSAVHPKWARVIVVRPHGAVAITPQAPNRVNSNAPHGSANITPRASNGVHSQTPATFHSSAPATFASHASSKGSSPRTGRAPSRPTSGYGSSMTAAPDGATQQSGSGWTDAQPVAQAAPHLTVSRAGSARGSVHASQSSSPHPRSSSAHHQSGRARHARFLAGGDGTGASDSAAVSAALGAWTGASVEVATVPTGCPDATSTTPEGGAAPGTGPTTSAPSDASPTGPGDSSQTTTAQAPGCGTGQDNGAQGENGQSNPAPGTGATDQSGQGDTGSGQGDSGTTGQGDSGTTGQGDAGTTGQGDTGSGEPGQSGGNPAQGNGNPAQGSSNPAQGSGNPAQGSGNPAQGNGNPAQGNPAQGNGNPAQGNGNPAQGNGNPAQDNGGQGQGTGGGTCPTDSTGAGAADAGQGGGDGASAVVTPAVGGSSADGTGDQAPPDTSCGQDTGSAPGGPLASPSPGTGDTGSQGDGSTAGGPLTAVSPGQDGSSPTPSPVTIAPITSLPAPSTNPIVPTTNPVTPITNPVTPVSPAPRTRTPVASTLPGDFSSVPRLTSSFGNGTAGGLLTPAAGGAGLGAATGAGAGTGLGAGAGALTPATSQIAARGGAKASHRAKRAHSGGSSTQAPPLINVPGAQALVHFVDRIPEWIWIAIAALAALAVVGFGAAFRTGRLVRRQAGAIAAASAAALTDPLTGVVNRRGFAEEVERELARARRYERPFVLAYVDVRGLKTVNDSEGHLAGDDLLKSVAGLLRDSARADDVVGRLGGDELGLLLVEQSAAGAEAVTHRVQSLLPERRAELGLASDWGLTIGTAAYPEDGETFDELLATADRRLYEQRGIKIRRA
jgi:diguanylate cyclase (GGDEF)-like protein